MKYNRKQSLQAVVAKQRRMLSKDVILRKTKQKNKRRRIDDYLREVSSK